MCILSSFPTCIYCNWKTLLYEVSFGFKDVYVQKYNSDCCFGGCETWSVILREAHRVRVFEDRVLRKLFGSKREEVTRSIFVDPWFIHSLARILLTYYNRPPSI